MTTPEAGSRDHLALIAQTCAAIRGPDEDAMARARAHQDRLAKPRGSLGALEDVSVRLAGLAGTSFPPVPEPAALALFAGDHGVHAQGVSPWPQSITSAMVETFLSGRAVINALARQNGVRLTVVDVGVAADLEPHPLLHQRRIRRGTDDLSRGPAMSRDDAAHAVATGIEIARRLVAEGYRCLLTGDMGIGNTTPAAALVAAFTGAPAEDVTGRGTGIDDATWYRKVDVVRQSLQVNQPDPQDPLGVLAAVGGFEHAATVGFLLGAAASRVPVIVDGVVASAAALAAARFAPDVVSALVAGHLSAEPGAARALAHLGLRPVLDLEMRLGEGSGAVLALPIVQAASRILHEVATIDELAPNPSRRAHRVLVLGGARSGKSQVAERMVEGAGSVTYAATGPQSSDDDPEWKHRVALHRERRPDHWRTVETRDLVTLLATDDPEPLVIDCLSTWLAATMDDCGVFSSEGHGPADVAAKALAEQTDALLDAWRNTRRFVVAISNEVGSGVVPATYAGRIFRDHLGWLNSQVAAESDEVWLVTAGIPQRLR